MGTHRLDRSATATRSEAPSLGSNHLVPVPRSETGDVPLWLLLLPLLCTVLVLVVFAAGGGGGPD